MSNLLENILSPQASRIYKVVQGASGFGFTAKQIGSTLKIFPNAVYREMKRLEDFGLVKIDGKYPIRYKSKKADEAIHFLDTLIRQELNCVSSGTQNRLSINFIHNRRQLLAFTLKDIRRAQHSIDILVSGHEVPRETVLAQKQAAERGVNIRMIIQNLKALGSYGVRAWKNIGVKLRHQQFMEARIFVFDKQIVYFTSYSESANQEAIGMRFDYAPYARLMNEMFEQKWQAAKDIKDLK